MASMAWYLAFAVDARHLNVPLQSVLRARVVVVGVGRGGGGVRGNLRVILVRFLSQCFKTYPNHIPGL